MESRPSTPKGNPHDSLNEPYNTLLPACDFMCVFYSCVVRMTSLMSWWRAWPSPRRRCDLKTLNLHSVLDWQQRTHKVKMTLSRLLVLSVSIFTDNFSCGSFIKDIHASWTHFCINDPFNPYAFYPYMCSKMGCSFTDQFEGSGSGLASGGKNDVPGLPQTLQQEFSLVNLQIRNVNVEVSHFC